MKESKSAQMPSAGKKKPNFTPPPQNQDRPKTIVIKLPVEVREINITCEFV